MCKVEVYYLIHGEVVTIYTPLFGAEMPLRLLCQGGGREELPNFEVTENALDQLTAQRFCVE
jgi:hypothetical protein